MTGLTRLAMLATVACLGLTAATGCTDEQAAGPVDPGVPSGTWRLVAYDSCQNALDSLRSAAKSAVEALGGGPWAGPAPAVPAEQAAPAERAAPPAAAEADSAAAAGQSGAGQLVGAAPGYSGTNTHESGVDEPDLVKTDGRRIITLSGGTLRVVDVATRTVQGLLDLSDGTPDAEAVRYSPADLLLAGDHALVLRHQAYLAAAGGMGVGAVDAVGVPDAVGAADVAGAPMSPVPDAVLGPELILIDLAGTPRVLSRLTVDGALVDARQVGSLARVVIRSSPRFDVQYRPDATQADWLEASRKAIDDAEISDWLPRIEVTTSGRTERTDIPCGDISRPRIYSATSMLTVLTVDLAASSLGATAPVTLVADGDTVYSNGPSLYVTSDQRWRAPMMDVSEKAPEPRTEIYKFDTSGPGRPTFVGGGIVPGYLLNQYSLSEWEGHLRVATTTNSASIEAGQSPVTESGVHVLAHRGDALTEVGSVTGLGKGEQIYAVRFIGAVGYVVTFRQTDPLYALDLRDPTRPAIRGELKIPGYSAYLHPVGTDRLIGIGQDATDQGQVTGTQISLFDVGNLADPRRLARYTLAGAHSEAEFDPHAFLYWPQESLLVVPLQPGGFTVPNATDARFAPPMTGTGALVLRIGAAGITELGFLQQPPTTQGWQTQIRRTLVTGQTLWTVSDGGLMANDITTLARLAWIPFT